MLFVIVLGLQTSLFIFLNFFFCILHKKPQLNQKKKNAKQNLNKNTPV